MPLFWRIFGTFWLALLMAAGLSVLLGRALNQDHWIIARHPALQNLAEEWTALYEKQGLAVAQTFLEDRQRQYGLWVQVFDEDGQRLGSSPGKLASGRRGRQLSQEYSTQSGQSYLFVYRIPHPNLQAWQRSTLLWPVSALAIALVVLTLFSLWLTLSITRPLSRLRNAVYALGQTSYQQQSLARLAQRSDELGMLAQDFNHMGEHLQRLISSQRQLLRDVSHELRSPLARLKVALALTERADSSTRAGMWPRLEQECDRLEALIAEILDLSRLDAEPGPASSIALRPLLERLQEDAQLVAPEQQIDIELPAGLCVDGWPDWLERALDNLLRNALRFNPPGQPIEIRGQTVDEQLQLSIRDQGPGVDEAYLAHLGEPFFRMPQQSSPGHGLGLAIARRAIERHGGQLDFSNHPQGGFLASIQLPIHQNARH